MASRQIQLKRCLPAWMEEVHKQSRGMSHSGFESQGSVVGMTQKFEAGEQRLQFDNYDELRVVDQNAASCPDEDVEQIKSVGLCAVTGRDRNCGSSVSAGHIIEQSMQLLTFPGTVVYSCHFADCAGICDDILTSLSSLDPVVVGFDMEWPVTFVKGKTPKTALIQLCLSEAVCYLFQVSAMTSFPTALKKLLFDAHVVLVGLNVEADLWRLERDFDIRVKPLMDRGSIIDVGRLANQKLKSSENWTLDGLCKNVLRKRLNKDAHIRCGDWKQIPLSEEQKMYATTDAYAGLLLYQCLSNK